MTGWSGGKSSPSRKHMVLATLPSWSPKICQLFQNSLLSLLSNSSPVYLSNSPMSPRATLLKPTTERQASTLISLRWLWVLTRTAYLSLSGSTRLSSRVGRFSLTPMKSKQMQMEATRLAPMVRSARKSSLSTQVRGKALELKAEPKWLGNIHWMQSCLLSRNSQSQNLECSTSMFFLPSLRQKQQLGRRFRMSSSMLPSCSLLLNSLRPRVTASSHHSTSMLFRYSILCSSLRILSILTTSLFPTSCSSPRVISPISTMNCRRRARMGLSVCQCIHLRAALISWQPRRGSLSLWAYWQECLVVKVRLLRKYRLQEKTSSFSWKYVLTALCSREGELLTCFMQPMALEYTLADSTYTSLYSPNLLPSLTSSLSSSTSNSKEPHCSNRSSMTSLCSGEYLPNKALSSPLYNVCWWFEASFLSWVRMWGSSRVASFICLNQVDVIRMNYDNTFGLL